MKCIGNGKIIIINKESADNMEMNMMMDIINSMYTVDELEDILKTLEAAYELCKDTEEKEDIETLIEEVKGRISYYYEVEEEMAKRDDKYYSINRCEILVERFFNVLEEGGQWTEMFLIRDLLMDEYITHRGISQVEIVQIDDIIENALEEYLIDNEPVIEMYYLDDIVNNIYKAIERGDIDDAFALVNAYGDNAQSNPYIYYCAVRELERLTGENYIELCL
jgi:hypothetical protein